MNYNAGLGLLFRPLDWFATGAYFSLDLPFFGDTNGAGAVVSELSFLKAGLILRWIPYSEGDDFQQLIYFDFRVGIRTCGVGGQLFESRASGKPLEIDATEYRILVGFNPGLKIGYTFCPATYTWKERPAI